MMETGNPSWKSPTSVTHYHYSYVNFVARETLSHCHLNPFSHDKLGNAMKTGGHISLLHFTFKGLGGCNLNTFSTKFTKKNLKKLHFTKTQNKLISFVLMLPFQGQTQNAGKFKQSKPNPDCWRPPFDIKIFYFEVRCFNHMVSPILFVGYLPTLTCQPNNP